MGKKGAKGIEDCLSSFQSITWQKYLPKCMDSLLKWNAPYVEYIFVNDGSTDESREIILRYAQDDRRIRLIDKENGGCASARNRGIEGGRG